MGPRVVMMTTLDSQRDCRCRCRIRIRIGVITGLPKRPHPHRPNHRQKEDHKKKKQATLIKLAPKICLHLRVRHASHEGGLHQANRWAAQKWRSGFCLCPRVFFGFLPIWAGLAWGSAQSESAGLVLVVRYFTNNKGTHFSQAHK